MKSISFAAKWNTILANERIYKARKSVLITYLLFYQIFYNWNIGSYLLLSSNKMESKRCGYTLFGGIVVILALCSISTVRGDDWDDELEFETDKSEARILTSVFNSTSLPDSYVSHFWFKALSIMFWSNVVHTKISMHESSTCVYRLNMIYIENLTYIPMGTTFCIISILHTMIAHTFAHLVHI